MIGVLDCFCGKKLYHLHDFKRLFLNLIQLKLWVIYCNLQVALYYEKLNKSKSTDSIPEKPKDVDVIDISDKNLKEAGDSLLEFLEEDKMKHRLQLN